MLHDHLLDMVQFVHALLASKRPKPGRADLICLTFLDLLEMGQAQRVTVDCVTPDWCPVTSGFPQSSILCPVLFINNGDTGLEGIDGIKWGGAVNSPEGRKPCRETSTN
ncbi:hypothetical protein HGM15179_000543 [Zosterops borbonicus]|uniref:Uncharacterized protein n=1 Tax=Zosterops borbonicus TaxID=364589 RepID=A0A8K1LTR7_9PASS|nr:hypothetical protein HGM15179_000543 [Zosterops borbonicus]